MYALSLLLSVPLLVVTALPSPHPHPHPHPHPYTIHESRSHLPPLFSLHPHTPSPPPTQPIPLRIALTQGNLHLGASELDKVSNPSSPHYGQHWTPAQIKEFFAPSQSSIDAVRAWLESSGIVPSRITLSPSKGWLAIANATISEAESLLHTKFNVYAHTETGEPHIACTFYALPAHLKPHIDFVTPTLHFDSSVNHRALSSETIASIQQRDGSAPKKRGPGKAASMGAPGAASLPKLGVSNLLTIFNELENCASQTVPICLRALYDIPPAGLQLATSRNSMGIVEFSPQTYLAADLDAYFTRFQPSTVGSRPVLKGIDGGTAPTSNTGYGYNGESDLDLEVAMTLVAPLKPVLYQVGDPIISGSFNNFLDALDGSYCTYEGGDDPTEDSIYPDPAPGGYSGTQQCGVYTPANVISVSYSYDETGLSPAYEQRQCNEYMKLGLQGVTLLFSSGDTGVAGSSGGCTDPATGQQTPTGSRFVPSFPAGCPYITSVGATQLPTGGTVLSREVALATYISSSGGFSDVFPLPSYQSGAVRSYFANHAPPYTSAQYNNSQHTRGFPDISANGANFVINVAGQFGMVYGTSASTPVVASVITLLNDARLALGKGPVGFINPALYANTWILNDITSGDNPGCGTNGFSAVSGWDPVTGLGTPNYLSMLAYFLTLG